MSLRLRTQLTTVVGATLLLVACAGNPPPPDWQSNAFAALNSFSSAYLRGDTAIAELELNHARREIARTGRADVLARAELTRCATRVASLEFDQCSSYQPLAQDASASERAYAAFLTGRWTTQDAALLPEHYRALALMPTPDGTANERSALSTLKDPLARLIAAGVWLQTGRLTPPDIDVAIETASDQGWRRPLLAWLGVQLQRANQATDPAARTRLQRRIDLILQTPHEDSHR